MSATYNYERFDAYVESGVDEQEFGRGARRMRHELGIARPILVDDADGTVHHAYGLMPNMSWVLGRGGTILYKAMWTSAAHLGESLEARPSARPAATVYAEELAPVVRDRGPRAVTEFARAEAVRAERARAASS